MRLSTALLVAAAAVSLVPATVHAAREDQKGGVLPFPAGEITCYVAGGSWNGTAADVQVNPGGGLRYVWPPSGLEVLTTEQCIANIGADSIPAPPGRAVIECASPVGSIVVAAIASAATIQNGVTIWRDEDSADVFLSTLACRVRRLE